VERTTARWISRAALLVIAGCQSSGSSGSDNGSLSSSADASGGSSSITGASATSEATGNGSVDGSGGTGATGDPKFDVGEGGSGSGDTGGPPPSCRVVDDMDAVGECGDQAPADSFEPEIQWMWTGPNGEAYSIVTPLVANLTDDDGSGDIDLCDVPDVVVVASVSSGTTNGAGHIYVLDGQTGAVHFMVQPAVDHTVTPALGDIDGDGMIEIVTANNMTGALMAFEHDGTPKWNGNAGWPVAYSGAIALADLDNDGDVEIIAGNMISDHMGTLLHTLPQPAGNWSATAAADLDADGDLEVVLGHAAYHHDGAQHYVSNIAPGYPQIADLDDDPAPEVLVTNGNGLSLLEDDGTVVYQDLRPTGDGIGFTTWLRPATVHDFDGDDIAEYAMSSANNYTVYEGNATIVWSAPVSDQSGIAAGTAFDFLGDGIAEAMYADETTMFIFDGDGLSLLETPRTSGTLTEYPVVADIDNDGSSEIVVVSNMYMGASPTVQVIRDVEDRWIQARRIWNQHTYHVTNVREDGTIPQFEQPHHTLLNTFRTNAQIENGGVCKPDPRG
jgi:hypothetical protein